MSRERKGIGGQAHLSVQLEKLRFFELPKLRLGRKVHTPAEKSAMMRDNRVDPSYRSKPSAETDTTPTIINGRTFAGTAPRSGNIGARGGSGEKLLEFIQEKHQ